ncbi:NAD(P)-binding domain-containing protein [Flavobacterium sp. CSZ]|uniref:NAD(P)-binding domain-containing protein n=1 Tax=Flavobacterium sp. CSZ TaxID=2783791 RepID=UPI00188C94F2|nr:NAD(P)-binding domain-containing protein [Flavobacterium sp. CSZ]MBF4488046.1 NAD(P)-binding domain-containing protein [Flavobacterium sp. CSZ]
MKIGIIGIGNITLELATRSALFGYEVLISNPRGTNVLKELTCHIGKDVKLVPMEKAAQAELIILFLNREDLENALRILPDMKGKIILHTNNPIFNLNEILDITSGPSSSDLVASLLPDCFIVKLFNPLHCLTGSKYQSKDRTKIFFTTENHKVKKNVKTYLDTLNFTPIELTDLKKLNT